MAEEINLDKTLKYVRDNNIISSDLDGETVMMSLEMNKYYGINTVGSDIWRLLENPRTFYEICEILMDTYNVGKDQCEHEVEIFLIHLLDNKLLLIDN